MYQKKSFNHFILLSYRFFLGFQVIVPKVEPIDSPLTDYSGENTNDTDIALLEDAGEKKYSISPESFSGKSVCTGSSDHSVRKWINEVSSTQPCLNVANEKNNGLEIIDEDKESIEIDKEVETVLQSGTIVESLSITTENLNSVSSEAQISKGIYLILKNIIIYGLLIVYGASSSPRHYLTLDCSKELCH